ncbi:twitchin-like [Liolophura sinensis]|uniref:twitchin-like n=1 Tax=Liolophura sinensis TaxID=3198878 RepID=UPI00315931D8
MDWSPMARGVMDTKYRLTGLRPGQDYLFRVRAETGQGLSEPTLPVTFYRRMVSPRVPVERPQLYDLEPDAVRLSWQPTSTYQAETPLRYTVEVREPQIKKWRPIARNIPETSYHVTGLKPKLDYEFRVRPETDKGLLEPTPSIPLYRKRVLPPLKFVEPVIVDDEPETVRLNWQRVTVPRLDAGDEELTYMIEAQRGPTMEWQPIARNIRDTSYQLTGLGPYEDYHFRIRGESRDFGYTEPSPSLPLYRRPILPNVPVSRPVIEDVDSTSVRLGWQRVHIPSFGNDDSPLTFMVESQEGPGSEWRPIARDIPDTKYVIRDLKPRHDYNFRIRGIKGPEISDPTPPLPVFRSPLQANWRPIREDFTRPSRPYFECLTIRVPPSMPIEKPILTDITGDSVGLTWRPARVPSNSNPPLYNVEIRKLPNMNWQRLAGGLTMTTYKATKLNPDRSYMFRIKAENEYGTSGSTMPASLGRPGSKFLDEMLSFELKKSYPEDEDGEDQGFGQRGGYMCEHRE